LEGWKELFCEEVLEANGADLAGVPDVLQQADYKNPQQVAAAKLEDLRTIFLGNSSMASVVQNRCILYSGGANACHRC
jgi:hypothetical protein